MCSIDELKNDLKLSVQLFLLSPLFLSLSLSLLSTPSFQIVYHRKTTMKTSTIITFVFCFVTTNHSCHNFSLCILKDRTDHNWSKLLNSKLYCRACSLALKCWTWAKVSVSDSAVVKVTITITL